MVRRLLKPVVSSPGGQPAYNDTYVHVVGTKTSTESE